MAHLLSPPPEIEDWSTGTEGISPFSDATISEMISNQLSEHPQSTTMEIVERDMELVLGITQDQDVERSEDRAREREVQDGVRRLRQTYESAMNYLEDWNSWFPFEFPPDSRIDDALIPWLRPMSFQERVDALSGNAVPLDVLIEKISDMGDDLRESGADNLQSLGAQMFLDSLAARIRFVVKHLARHMNPLCTLEFLYSEPTNTENRYMIESVESHIDLPVRSCFLGNYRVGFGNIHDFLRDDPGLRERAHRAELRSTSIADEPAWELPHPAIENGLDHDPPPNWRSTTYTRTRSQPIHRYIGGYPGTSSPSSISPELLENLAASDMHAAEFSTADLIRLEEMRIAAERSDTVYSGTDDDMPPLIRVHRRYE